MTEHIVIATTGVPDSAIRASGMTGGRGAGIPEHIVIPASGPGSTSRSAFPTTWVPDSAIRASGMTGGRGPGPGSDTN
jgi:hypothetical protein